MDKHTYLINEKLEVGVGQLLRRANNLMQVCVHKLVDNVNIVAALSDRSAENVHNTDNVLMSASLDNR